MLIMLISTLEDEFTIGQLAEAVQKVSGLRCTPAMIYNYEKHRLLQPPRRTSGGVRKYRREDIARVVQIKQAQLAGLTLEEIKENLENGQLPLENVPDLDIPNDRKTAILTAAAVVFPRKGFLETTLNDIAREAGVAVSTVYQYFENKEDLFLALTKSFSFIQSLEGIKAALSIGESGDLASIRQAMIQMANSFLYAPVANVEIIRLFITEVKRFPRVGKVYRERLVAPGQELLAQFFQGCIEHGVFRGVDPHLAASAFFGMFLDDVINEYLFLDRDMKHMPTPEGVAMKVDIFINGMITSPQK